MNTLRLGTRKSALAQAQANMIAKEFRAQFPDFRVELVLITTSGDRLSSFPAATGGETMDPLPEPAGDDVVNMKALFTKEIEEALLDHRIDLAVHSLKDMAAELPKGLKIAAVPLREDPRDAWISKTKTAFKQMPKNAKVGTGAVRRQAQLKHLFPQIELIPMRGNVDTRLKKLSEGNLDGIILAMAGLKRLGLQKAVTEALSVETLLPAPGQGCLGLQIRENDGTLETLIKRLNHPPSYQAARAERAFLKTLGGSCQTPIAGHAQVTAAELHMTGLVISLDGVTEVRGEIAGPSGAAESLGATLAKQLLEKGAKDILCR